MPWAAKGRCTSAIDALKQLFSRACADDVIDAISALKKSMMRIRH